MYVRTLCVSCACILSIVYKLHFTVVGVHSTPRVVMEALTATPDGWLFCAGVFKYGVRANRCLIVNQGEHLGVFVVVLLL
jgi:hypothetical protein